MRYLQPKPWQTKTVAGVGGATEYSAKVAATTRGLVAPVAIELLAANATQAGNIKRYFQTHPEPLTAIAACSS